jgi:hypothetical protein
MRIVGVWASSLHSTSENPAFGLLQNDRNPFKVIDTWKSIINSRALEGEALLNNISILNSYLTENTLHLHYKNGQFNKPRVGTARLSDDQQTPQVNWSKCSDIYRHSKQCIYMALPYKWLTSIISIIPIPLFPFFKLESEEQSMSKLWIGL